MVTLAIILGAVVIFPLVVGMIVILSNNRTAARQRELRATRQLLEDRIELTDRLREQALTHAQLGTNELAIIVLDEIAKADVSARQTMSRLRPLADQDRPAKTVDWYNTDK